MREVAITLVAHRTKGIRCRRDNNCLETRVMKQRLLQTQLRYERECFCTINAAHGVRRLS